MSTGYVVATIALMVVLGVALVVAAFLDRRRGREITHDPSRLFVGPRPQARQHEHEED